MTRINITERDEYTGRIKVTGWFDDSTGERFGEDTRWDGSNHISVNTGSQWDHEELYRTAGGRWVRHEWSQRQGAQDRYAFVSDEQAREWLIVNEEDDETLERLFGVAPDPERGPGRPEIGPPIKATMPPEITARLDEIAARDGVSRAEVIRRLLEQALDETIARGAFRVREVCDGAGYRVDPGESYASLTKARRALDRAVAPDSVSGDDEINERTVLLEWVPLDEDGEPDEDSAEVIEVRTLAESA